MRGAQQWAGPVWKTLEVIERSKESSHFGDLGFCVTTPKTYAVRKHGNVTAGLLLTSRKYSQILNSSKA